MLLQMFRRAVVLILMASGTLTSVPVLSQENAKEAYSQAVPKDSLKRMSATDKLMAIEEIRKLPMRYGRCISQKDWQCVRNQLFAPDFYYLDGPNRVHGPDGFIEVMRRAGCYDRVLCIVYNHGAEIELLSPTIARGIAAADFTFYYPPGQAYETTGTEVVAPGQETHTPTYYYQTYEKIDGIWKIKTSDHISFDLRTEYSGYTRVREGAYVTPDGVRPYER